jgi:hypothetical protein
MDQNKSISIKLCLGEVVRKVPNLPRTF